MDWMTTIFGDTTHPIAERAYWGSQILLLVVAVMAAVFARRQVSTFRLFELLKFLEEERVRSARRQLFLEVVETQTKWDWWSGNDRLDETAGTICASYDIVARMAKGRSRRFFKKHWAYSICWTHEALEDFLIERRARVPDAFEGYTGLYKEARRYDPRPEKRPVRWWQFLRRRQIARNRSLSQARMNERDALSAEATHQNLAP
jgi:hypothetical protein